MSERERHPEDLRNAERSMHVCLLTTYLFESIGLRQLCSVLQARGHRCTLIFVKEFQWGEFRPITSQEREVLISLLRRLRPDLVGIGLTSSFVADLSYDLADMIRRQVGAPVILGGFHPSVCPEEALEHADFVCRGEGEEALADLADALARGRATDAIANIWTTVDGEIRKNEVRPLRDDLDSLPFPAFASADTFLIEADNLWELDPATRIPRYHTYASRMACPFNCSFCGGPWLRRELYAGKGNPRRYRSVGTILAEIKQARESHPKIEIVQFWDEVFAVRPPEGWLDEFCDCFPREIGLPFAIWSHPAVVTEATIGRLREAGLKGVVLGVESGSQRVRREVLNRRETDAAVLRAAEILHRHNLEVGWDFIVDIPWLTEENCRGTFELIMRLPRPFDLGMHSMSFLPGAAITERALAEGKISPAQVSRADQPLPERFEEMRWKYRLSARDRSSAYWHSMIYLAGMSFVPRSLLWHLYRLAPLLKLCPKPLTVAAEAARIKKQTGELKPHAALAAVYPGVAGALARHPNLGRLISSTARGLAKLVARASSGLRR